MTFIKRLTISGYRGFRHSSSLNLAVPDNEPGSGLTVLTGPNNGGKSSIIEVINFTGAQKQPELGRNRRNNFVDLPKVEFEFNNDTTIALETLNKSSYLTRWAANGETKEASAPKLNIFSVPSSRSVDPHFNRNSSTYQAYAKTTLGQSSNRNMSAKPNSLLVNIAEDREQKTNFDADVKKLLGVPLEWEVDQIEDGQYVFAISNKNGNHTSDGLGFGVLSLFYLIAAFSNTQTAEIVTIDEPEVSLHPQIQRRVNDYIVEKAEQRQIILATHSPYFTGLNYAAGLPHLARVASDDAAGSKIYQLSPQTRKKLESTLTDINNPHLLGLAGREIFFVDDSRRVVLVEGQEDVTILNNFLSARDQPMPEFDFFGWGVGGAEKMPLILTTFQELGITNVSTLLDGDKTELHVRLQKDFPDSKHHILPQDDIRDKPARKPLADKSGLFSTGGKPKPAFLDAINKLILQLVD